MNDKKIGYNFIMGGRVHFKKSVIDVAEKEIETLFDSEEWYYADAEFKNNSVLEQDGPTAFIGAPELVYGVIVFVGAWTGTKVLDELYDHKIKPGIVSMYEKAKDKAASGKDFSFEYQSLVWYEEHKVLIMVSIEVGSELELKKNLDLIKQAHSNALKWLKINGKHAPIHKYIIKNKIIDTEPSFYRNLKAIQVEKGRKIIKSMKEIH